MPTISSCSSLGAPASHPHGPCTLTSCPSGSKFYREERDAAAHVRYRTECWLERCLFAESVCAPHEQAVFAPLAASLPMPGAAHVSLSFSGLDQPEVC